MRRLAIIVGCALSFGIAKADVSGRDIVLKGYSNANYGPLNAAIGHRVCVLGPLQINTAGIYFQLKPIESEGIIDVGFSRILTELSHDYAAQQKMKSGEAYRLCGVLQDATPWKRCEWNDCKWYKLEAAELRRNPGRD